MWPRIVTFTLILSFSLIGIFLLIGGDSIETDEVNSNHIISVRRLPASVQLASKQTVLLTHSQEENTPKQSPIKRVQLAFNSKKIPKKKPSANVDLSKFRKYKNPEEFKLGNDRPFNLVDGFEAIRLSEISPDLEEVHRVNDFAIVKSELSKGFPIAVDKGDTEVIILSGLITVMLEENTDFETLIKEYDLTPQRVFEHLHVGYFKPKGSLIETYRLLKNDTRIKNVTFEPINQRMNITLTAFADFRRQ